MGPRKRNFIGRLWSALRKQLGQHSSGSTPDTSSPILEPPNKTVAGPITGPTNLFKPNLFDFEINMTEDQIDAHMPVQQIVPLNPKRFKALSAAQLKKLKLNPHLFANPQQYVDYRIYETILKHTFVGALMDSFVSYLVGTGFKPELELINPGEDEEANNKEVEKHQDIITSLLEVERNLDNPKAKGMDVPFKQKMVAAITSMLAYNRGALVFDFEHAVEVNGKKYSKIPTNAIFAHARDLGMIEIDPDTRRLKAVEWVHARERMVPIEQMIYLWNPISSAKVYNSWFYGASILSPLMSSAKLLRTLLSEAFPAMAHTAWAGVFLLTVNNEGDTPNSKQEEWQALSKNMVPGKPNVLIKNPDDTRVDNINYEPKIEEFRSLSEFAIKKCISILGLPQVGFFDESAANRATLVGKIQLTMRTVIDPKREWIGDAIAQQWYIPLVKIIDPKILETFKIKVSWDDLHISEWYDNVSAVLELDGRKGLKDDEFGELIGVDNYPNMVDPNAQVQPGGNSNKMSMTDSETGNKFEMKQKKGDKDAVPRMDQNEGLRKGEKQRIQ